MSRGTLLGVQSASSSSSWEPGSLATLVSWAKIRSLGLSDGASITSVTDLSPAGNHLTATAPGNYPTKQTSGLAVMRCDGVDDFVKATFTLNQPYTRFSIVKFLSAYSSNRAVMDGITADSGDLFRSSSTHMGMYGGVSLSAATTPQAWHYYVEEWNGASSRFRVDGVTLVSGNAGAANPGGLSVGAQATGGAAANIDIPEWGVATGMLSAPDLASLESYLAAITAQMT